MLHSTSQPMNGHLISLRMSSSILTIGILLYPASHERIAEGKGKKKKKKRRERERKRESTQYGGKATFHHYPVKYHLIGCSVAGAPGGCSSVVGLRRETHSFSLFLSKLALPKWYHFKCHDSGRWKGSVMGLRVYIDPIC